MTVAGAVYFPLDCHLMPARLMTCLTREIDRAGGQVSYGTTVTGWRTAGDRIEAVRTSGGDVTADEYVVGAGVWSEAVLRGLGLAIPMQAGKGYSLTLEPPPVTLRVPAILSEARVAVTPMGSAVRFGGTMELTGLDEAVNPARVQGIVRSLPRYYPDVTREHFERVPVRCGLRPCSPDGLPYLGRVRRFANLSVATAHAMLGVSLAPITGQLVAEIVSGEPPSCPIEALSPDRYA
jgi:D-amino-acid dehydrogenase